MPQVDLTPLFTPPPKDRSPRPDPFLLQSWKDPRGHTPTGTRPHFKLTLSQITNIGFVLVACLGGVISALYFIRGGELFQEASAWPRELFYGRPVPRAPAAVIPGVPKSSIEESGDPFSPASRLLSPNSPLRNGSQPNRTTFSPSLARPFSRLSMPAPGGDALSRSLIQSVPASAQSTATAAGAAEQTAAASKIPQQTAATAKMITSHAKTAAQPRHPASPKLKSGVSPAAARQVSPSRTTGGQTPVPIQANVAEFGSHIGQSNPPLSSTSPIRVGNATHSASHAIGSVKAGTGMISVHGLGRLGGR